MAQATRRRETVLTWEEVCSWARAHWQPSLEKAKWIELDWSAFGGGPKQMFVIMLAQIYEQSSLVIMAEVCDQSLLTARMALEECAEIAIPAVVFVGDRFRLRQTIALAELETREQLEGIMRRLAAEAARLRTRAERQTETSLAMFAHVAD